MEKEWNCRPPIFNNGKRELGRVVRASRRATFKEIEQLISTKACEDTIRKELKKFSYASRVVVKKPFLNEKQQKVRGWRNASEKFKKECLVPTFKSGRTSIMVYGAIAGGKKLKFVYEERHEDKCRLHKPSL
ncbi:hypothetical protein G6F68_008773 [Rhizopus microsporus]|nr:hypothetical protein G6F67_004664 [Rhizopus microsporus]KAG1258424.1 hypothetical protein G6F68_008773 [Rhizopus microsporus]